MENKKGTLVVISGPSGSGKGTICKEIIEKKAAGVSISATTRAPRTGEADGVNYFFLTRDEFEKRISEDKFLEYATYNGNYYGTPKEYVEKCLEKGENIILEIDVQGALRVKKLINEAVLIMTAPPDYKTLESRLAGRGDTAPEDMKNRLAAAKWELEQLPFYDYIVVNRTGELEAAVNTVCDIINGVERKAEKTSENRDFLERFYSI